MTFDAKKARRGPNAPKILLPTEKQVEKNGDYFMAALGFETVRFSQPRHTMQTFGIPDRRYYHRERKLALWWEAKRPGGRQSDHQRGFQQMVEAVGEVYVLGDTDNLAEAVKTLFKARSAADPAGTMAGG